MPKAQVGKYLTFKLGTEEYGLEVLKVQEIIGLMNVTRVPRMPVFLRGVINLRGKLIPVVEMRKKFELPSVSDTDKTCIIVVQILLVGMKVTLGIIVDSVAEVLNIEQEQLEDAPAFGTQINTEFMLGMGKVGPRVVILLDIDRVLSLEDHKSLHQMVAPTEKQPLAPVSN